jgi:hypothetical protein
MSFHGYFRPGILTGAKKREGMKNKVGPRSSEPNRPFTVRDKSRLSVDYFVFFKSMNP